MRLIVGAGGTGGGVYPAIAILQRLNPNRTEILWVGSQGGMETDLVQQAGFKFAAIPSAGLHGVGLKALPGNISRLLHGYLEARRIIKEFRPDVMLLTGGYVSIPVALAGRRTPSLLFMPDIEPFLSIKLIARFAKKIAVTTVDSLSYFSGQSKVIVTGYPVRSDLLSHTSLDLDKKFNLIKGKPVVMVFGGSQGAQSMNRALYPLLPSLLQRFQIIHLCGRNNWDENEKERARIPSDLVVFYHPFPYLHAEDLAFAFHSADLVVSRSGAAVLGEYPHFELPAILVPYPHAWRYQFVNARYLEAHGAAMIIKDEDMSASLSSVLNDLFDHPDRLQSMSEAMGSLAQPEAALKISHLLEEIAAETRPVFSGGVL